MTQSSYEPGVAAMLHGYSIELNPGQSKVINAAVDRLEAGTEVFLAWIPGSNPIDAVQSAVKLQRAGLIPVPHIGARHLESAAQLEQLAARFTGEAGVDRVLMIGGDRAKPAGPYDSSLAVMQTGAFQKRGVRHMSVAGFPEGNPNIPKSILDEVLAAKQDFALANGVDLSIVTQFCFKAEPILTWCQHIRSIGVNVPVRIGLAGPADLLTLTRYAVRCGVGNSLHVLSQYPSFAKLLTEKGPEPIIRDLAISEAENAATSPFGIAGLHFYVFGGFQKTLDWIVAELSHSSRPAHI